MTEQEKQTVKYASIALAVLICVAIFGLYSRFHKSESNFTPEEKAVIVALRNARGSFEQAQADVEKSKAELREMINEFRALAVVKGIDTNVETTWLPASGKGVMCGDKQCEMGYRADGFVMWRR